MKKSRNSKEEVKKESKKSNKILIIGIVVAIIVIAVVIYFIFFSKMIAKDVAFQEKYLLQNNITKYEESVLVLFECLDKEGAKNCPAGNSKSFSGKCIKIDSCRADFLVQMKNITTTERVFNNAGVENAWNNCYDKGLSSVRINSTYLEGYVEESFGSCWKTSLS